MALPSDKWDLIPVKISAEDVTAFFS